MNAHNKMALPSTEKIRTDVEFLSQVSSPVDKDEIEDIKNKLLANFDPDKMVELAAIQVGVLKRASVVYTGGKIIFLYNASIINKSSTVNTYYENCLSLVTTKKVRVHRAHTIVVLNGDGQERTFKGFDAMVVQHSLDHYDGILLTHKTKLEPVKVESVVGRNAKCPCGSGEKYKRCCMGRRL